MNGENRTVLLQTTRAFAFNETGTKSVPVRVLFDNSGQGSYVSEKLRSKLTLNPN